MPRKCGQHVVVERNTGVDCRLAGSVQVEGQFNGRFRGLAGNRRGAVRGGHGSILDEEANVTIRRRDHSLVTPPRCAESKSSEALVG